MEYKVGSTNTVADSLSRHDTEEAAVLAISGPRFVYIDRLQQATTMDTALVALKDKLAVGTRAGPWSLIDGLVTFHDRLYIPPASPLLHEVLTTVHDDGHEGVQRTLHLHRDFHSPNLRKTVKDYVLACATCQRYKSEHLHPRVTNPTAAHAHGGLDRHRARLHRGAASCGRKIRHLDRGGSLQQVLPLHPPRTPDTAKSVAQAFFAEIVRLHGVSQSMVFDRDPIFTSAFWCELMRLAGTKLHMTSAFHPQSDGQTEAANKVIIMYLRCLTGDHPRQWVRWLQHRVPDDTQGHAFQDRLWPRPAHYLFL